MYEKNADIMSSLAGAKDTVSKGALSLLAKLKGTSQNDIDNSVRSQLPPDIASGIDSVRNTVQSQLPSDVSKIVDDVRSQPMGELADKATKALSDLKIPSKSDTSPSALSYIPGIGGYLGGLAKPTPGRGRFVSSLGEGITGNAGAGLGGALGFTGGAALGGVGHLLMSLLSKGKYHKLTAGLGAQPAMMGGAALGGLTGGSLGTHAGAGLFHDIAAKPEKSAELTGNQEEIDVNNNDKIEAADLAALRKRKKPVKSAELIGDQEELDVNDNGKIEGVDLANLRKGKKLSKDKTKFAEWPAKPTFTANMAPLEKKPNPFVPGKKPSAKADTAGAEAALAKLGSQDNCSPSRSAAGDSKGVKYKQQTEDHATGTAAFDSLDKYLRMSKKAGLNDFQTNFFGRLIQEGRNEHEIYAAVKQAGDQFGAEVSKELKRGLKKLGFAGLGSMLGKGLYAGGKALMGNSGNIAKIGVGGGALAAGAGAGYGAAKMPGAVQEAAPAIGASAANTAMDRMQKMPGQIAQKLPSQFGDMAGQALQKLPAQFGDMAGQVMQRMPFQMGGGQSGLGQTTGGFAGPYKQSSEKRAFAGLLAGAKAALPAIGRYMGIAGGAPGAAAKGIFNAAKGSGATAGEAALQVLKNPAIKGQMITGASTGAMNPFTGLLATGDENESWGNYLGRSALSGLAGAGAGLAGGAGTQNLMRRMGAGSQIGATGDLVGTIAGYDTGGMGAKGGFIGGGLMPAAVPKWMGAGATRLGGGTPGLPGMTGAMGGRAGNTADLLEKLDPLSHVGTLLGKGIGKSYNAIKGNAPGALNAAKGWAGANPIAASIAGVGGAGLAGGAYLGNRAVNAMEGARGDVNQQMNLFRAQTNNQMNGLREQIGGGMGGIGQFFNENKHWLMPALLAGGGALAGNAVGGGAGAALGGLSLPALYMMSQNGMFGGGGAANPLLASAKPRADYAQQNQQYERENIDKQVADRNRDPRLASPTAKKAGDRAVRLMRHFAKN